MHSGWQERFRVPVQGPGKCRAEGLSRKTQDEARGACLRGGLCSPGQRQSSLAHTAEGGSLGRASSRSLHWQVSAAPVSLETVGVCGPPTPTPAPACGDAPHFRGLRD